MVRKFSSMPVIACTEAKLSDELINKFDAMIEKDPPDEESFIKVIQSIGKEV